MTTIKKTLGGDRLGGENKMDVELHGFNRSSHDIGFLFKTDQACGTLVPSMCDIATDGTDYYMNLRSKIRTLPTNGPIFGVFKHQIDVFKIPIRLYNAELHNNMLGIGLKMSEVKLPMYNYAVARTPAGSGNKWHVAKDSLTAYLGISGFGTIRDDSGNVTRDMTSIFDAAYWDIYKNYYANKQEEIGYVIEPEAEEARLYSIQVDYYVNDWITEYMVEGNNWRIARAAGAWMTIGSSLTYKFDKKPNVGASLDMYKVYFSGGGYLTPREIIKYHNVVLSETENGFKLTWTENSTFGTVGNNGTDPMVTNILTTVAAGNGIKLSKFELSNIDEMRERILKAPKGVHFIMSGETSEAGKDKLPYSATTKRIKTGNPTGDIGNGCFYPQAGLGIKTYLSDRFNNWLSTEWIDGENGINEITAVKVEDGKISMDALILQKKLYMTMNRIAISGGSYNDWREAVYGQRTIQLPESPVYEGGMSAEIGFDEVVQTSAGDDQNPLGSLAGRGSADGRTRGGQEIHIHVDEPSMIMVIESITPRVTYSQGNKWYTGLKTMDDLHKPGLDGIGFQELITEEIAAFDTEVYAGGKTVKFSAGKQPSWIQYQTAVDQSFGSFAADNELEFMSVNRKYEQDSTGHIKDLTTYIDPTMYNVAFADAKLSAKNFWVQIAMDVTVRRVMSANQIPNL